MKKYLYLAAAAICFVSVSAHAQDAGLAEQSLSELAASIAKGETSSEAATAAYLQRIAQIDDAGPMLNAVIATFPDALDQARMLDQERAAGKLRGPLHGVPILLKDNIEAKGALATTAGSLALKGNMTGRDAPIVARLRAAGAVILGKTNLSEWANIRSNNSTSGWSAIGGLTKNPHALDRNACGSSSGSGSAIAAGLAAAALGTETDGSVVCPSSVNGITGFKPTVGMLPRTFIVPISHSQDTAGPMTRTVRDAALLMSVMAGPDASDAATADAGQYARDFTAGLSADAVRGVRIGVLRDGKANAPVFDSALEKLRGAGAILVEMDASFIDQEAIGKDEFKVLLAELKADLAAYLQALPAGLAPHKTLADVIAFNRANAKTELQYFGQDTFASADKEAALSDAKYIAAREHSLRRAGELGLDQLMTNYTVAVIASQTNGPAWLTTLGKGDAFIPPSASMLPAVAGYPHLTVPMGASANGLPVGISFIGRKWDDHLVLKIGYAFEQAANARIAPAFLRTVGKD
jgi:amidase